MREILFRGKHVLDGRWIEGFYNGVRPDLATMQAKECHRIFSLKSLSYDVDPETVGQYTGLTDKNGTKIFEGDVLRLADGETGVIVFRDAGFALDNSGCSFCVSSQCERLVIGNIHDNPELMEVRHAE